MKIWNYIRSIISSLALLTSSLMLTLLFSSIIFVCGLTTAILCIICGIVLCVVIATIPFSKTNEWIKDFKIIFKI